MSKKDKTQKASEAEQDIPVTEETTETLNAEGLEAENQEETTQEDEENTDPIVEKEKELAELKDKYIRLMAEFENYKRRTVKEKMDMMSTAARDTLSALLPVLDDFDRAKTNAESDDSTEVFSEGVTLVYNKLYAVLNQRGLEPMESNGTAFDPELHEAITEIPAPSEEMKGKVIDTIEKGYTLRDKIIRYAKVVVGK